MMSEQQRPILYSFRRCPYAMRARMAIFYSRQSVELREILLRDKPDEMLAVSPKGTVPVLIRSNGSVLDESFEIMEWALSQNDPENWLQPELGNKEEMHALIGRIEGPFKTNLDRYKYANRYAEENNNEGVDPVVHRDAAFSILDEFEKRLNQSRFLFGARLSLADIATAPFIRQFANTDLNWFNTQPRPKLQNWLAEILGSDLFAACMIKYPPWNNDRIGIQFPDQIDVREKV